MRGSGVVINCISRVEMEKRGVYGGRWVLK
jgi:hypothetical protein